MTRRLQEKEISIDEKVKATYEFYRPISAERNPEETAANCIRALSDHLAVTRGAIISMSRNRDNRICAVGVGIYAFIIDINAYQERIHIAGGFEGTQNRKESFDKTYTFLLGYATALKQPPRK